MYLVRTSEQMRRADAATMSRGLKSPVLMERAALGVFDVIRSKRCDLEKVLILAGPGNNGGDGVALARLLAEEGFRPCIKVFGDPAHYSDDLNTQLSLIKCYNVCFVDEISPDSYTLIIDSVFGVGLKRDVSGEIKNAIEKVNASHVKVVSIDIPSGIDSDTGHVRGIAVKADVTVGISDAKPGYYICEAKDYCGEVIIKNIGIIDGAEEGFFSGHVITDDDLLNLPERDERGNKSTFGKLLVIAGSREISGAAYLCAKAALSCGIGMVHIFTHECNRTIIGTLMPEALITTYGDDSKDLEKLSALIDWADAAVIGPGIGTGDFSRALFETFIRVNTLPAVLDADALNIIASEDKYTDIELSFPVIVTPHIGEMSRLIKIPADMIKDDPIGYASAFSKDTGFTCVLKDDVTVIMSSEGHYYINTSGCSALASAGSGDVLTGMIAGYILRYKELELPLAALAVYEHGKRGERAASEKGADAACASDLLAGKKA